MPPKGPIRIFPGIERQMLSWRKGFFVLGLLKWVLWV